MADQKIVPFLFEDEKTVRVVEIGPNAWFVVADVCAALGIKNPTQAAATLDADERAMLNIGRQGDANCVSEGGLYTLILRSRDATKPGTLAHRFRKWVTGEVLPAIRKTGNYSNPNTIEVIRRKPFEEWTVEEVNAYRGLVTEARHTLNVAAAAWMMERLGFPMPPRHLLPAWQQGIEGF
ncbi:BRO family protein [Roseomonas mucosa]|uniref:BRO-N domain-containing protein n=1 Tax=Roseomonas mucosa TaxID=207340 RepID=UPI0030D1C58B